MAKKKPTKEELAKEVSRLEKKLRELQEASSAKPGEAGGLAENVLSSLGKMVPGLENLIEIASQMPEFHERLASIDEQIKRKFKAQPLRRASSEIASGMGRGVMGIPPGVRRGQAGPARAGRRRSPGKPAVRGKYRKPEPPKVRISPDMPEQLPVDVFDEDEHIVVLAEAHGLKREHVTVSVEENVLLISVDAPQRKGVQRVEMPCEVDGKPKVSLAKGILKIQLNKANKS